MRICGLSGAQVLLLCALNEIVDGWSIHSSWRTPTAAAPQQAAFVAINRRGSSRYWPLFQAKGPQESSPSGADPTNTTVGIGGRDGLVYDVNSLKRNIVQETVRKFKNEIWTLLGDPIRDDNILEDKLAALVQTSPVSTTTDSNLLDGDWKYVFGSRQTASTLLDPRRFEIATRQNSKSSVHTSSVAGRIQDGLFRSSCREIHLENVLDHEDSYVLDRTAYLGGLFRRTRRYTIKRLTRTTLDMALEYSQWSFLGDKHATKPRTTAKSPSQAVRVLYVDSDLCIVTSSDDPAKSAFQVYTKSAAWASHAKRVQRRFVSTLGRFQSYVYSFLRIVKRMILPTTARSQESVVTLGEIPGTGAHGAHVVRVVTLGDSDNDEQAWEGEEDPFVHLSADERQEYLKQLRVRDVTKAGRRFQRRNKRKLNAVKRSNRKTFKKPD